jgi:CMP/dCMP kinase
MIITIDGPAGTGKSTIAQLTAKRLGFTYFNTGATYRSLTWYLLDRKIDDNDEKVMPKAMVDFRRAFSYDEKKQAYRINEVDITEELQGPEVRELVSQVAQHAYVRDQMMPIQRDFAESCTNTVFEGRDLGTVIFPKAKLKIFLTASAEVRANRRLKDFVKQGEEVDYEAVLTSIRERDHRDTTRKLAPLKQADDGILLDTSNLTIEQVVDAVCDHYKAVSL